MPGSPGCIGKFAGHAEVLKSTQQTSEHVLHTFSSDGRHSCGHAGRLRGGCPAPYSPGHQRYCRCGVQATVQGHLIACGIPTYHRQSDDLSTVLDENSCLFPQPKYLCVSSCYHLTWIGCTALNCTALNTNKLHCIASQLHAILVCELLRQYLNRQA